MSQNDPIKSENKTWISLENTPKVRTNQFDLRKSENENGFCSHYFFVNSRNELTYNENYAALHAIHTHF